MLQRLFYVLSNFFPERLASASIVNAPRFFSLAWSAIRALINPVTAAKVDAMTVSVARPSGSGLLNPHENGSRRSAAIVPRDLLLISPFPPLRGRRQDPRTVRNDVAHKDLVS